MASSTTKKNNLPTLFFVALLFLVAIFISETYKVNAGASNTLSGYAWSDTTGWISFNCTDLGTCGTINYGVDVDPSTGNMSGYAWSENIGWISFNPSDVSGCPSAPCTPNINKTTGTATGWFKALSGGTAQSGGWDGWVSLSGISPTYGITVNHTTFSGYAWGSDVVGWISFSQVVSSRDLNPALPTATLSATPRVVSGENSTVTWTSANASNCVIDKSVGGGGWQVITGNASPVGGGSLSDTITANTTYRIICTGPTALTSTPVTADTALSTASLYFTK